MKIGMIVSDLNVSGGYQKLVLRLTEELSSLGHEVFIYTLIVDKQKCYPEIIKNIKIISLNKKNVEQNIFKKIYNKIIFYKINNNNYKELSKKVRNDLDVLIIHNENCLYSLSNILSFYKIKPKVFWMLNNEVSESLYLNIWNLFYNKFIKTKGIIYKIGTFISIYSIFLHSLRVKKEIKFVDEFLAYDSFNQKLLEKKLNIKAINVLAGADIESFNNITHSNISGYFEIISVGVLFPYRRYEDLIEAVAMLKNEGLKVMTTIVGLHTFSKKYSTKLKKLVKDKNLTETIIFIEFASKSELIDIYKKANVFVFVNDGQTWGISVFEAIAADIPVILTNNIGASDLIKNNINGIVVKPKSPIDIYNAIKIIMDKDKAKLFSNNAKMVLNEVSWKSYTSRILNLIK